MGCPRMRFRTKDLVGAPAEGAEPRPEHWEAFFALPPFREPGSGNEMSPSIFCPGRRGIVVPTETRWLCVV